MPLHIGTHVDALCHAWYDDKLYNGYLGDTLRSTTGANCGIALLEDLMLDPLRPARVHVCRQSIADRGRHRQPAGKVN